MTIKEKIEKQAAYLIIEEIKNNGFSIVANPEKVKEKVYKNTGIELTITNSCLLKFNQLKLF